MKFFRFQQFLKIKFKNDKNFWGDVMSCGNILLNERTYFILQQCAKFERFCDV